MKIYHKVDYWKGYIPSDKVHYNHIPFENYSLKNFGIDAQYWNTLFRKQDNKKARKSIVNQLKCFIQSTSYYKDIVKDGYHTALYLNFNVDGIDSFISR